MLKILVSVYLLIFLVACKNEKAINYGPYRAIICEENDKSFKKYIFDRNTGYLYFYSSNRDEFIPLNLKYEAGFFSEDIPEVFSIIKKNKLGITDIEYDKKFEGGYQKIINIINLDNLIKKTVYKNEKKDLVTFKVICKWIDPKSDKKVE